MADIQHDLQSLLGQSVVLDARGLFVYSGILAAVDQHYVVLEEADVHDLRDTSTTREVYVMELKKFGIRPNRRRVLIQHNEIASISRLEDVIE